MSVFDQTPFGGKMKEAEPFWWTREWTAEQKQIAGDPKNRIGHMHRTKQRIDAGETAHPDSVFGPEIAR